MDIPRWRISMSLARSFPRLKPETSKNVNAGRMRAVIRLNRFRQRVSGEVHPDPGFDAPHHSDIPRVAECVSSDSKCASVEAIQPLFQIRLIAEQLVFIHQL